MSLVARFREFITTHQLIGNDDRVLLAVSGGVDSMVLMRLMADAGYRFAVAHCNFQLRGAESDGDERFVEQEVAKLGVEYHSTRFDTEGVMAETGESMEMAARRLRYEWFEELCDKHGYSVVAVAHHLDDSIETCFINMLRGTGLRGLTGISVRNRRVVRPLLFATRDEILSFAKDRNVLFREDSSNSSTKYLRNRIRHEFVPKMREINPQYTSVMRRNIAMLDYAQQYIDASIARIKSDVLQASGDGYIFDVNAIDASLPRSFVIYEILNSEFGFKGDVVDDICAALNSGVSGRRFYTPLIEAVVDRGSVIITPKNRAVTRCDALLIKEEGSYEYGGQIVRFECLDIEAVDTLNQGANVALLDADKIAYPLQVRVWRDGDSFVPLGMRGHKKVSDFLVDNKVSVVDKERQLLLLSDGDVAWVVGRRIDNRFAITKNTQRVLRVRVD